MDKHELVDVWPEYTLRNEAICGEHSSMYSKAVWIFFFFFNVRGANVDVNMVKVNPSYLSDHSLVILELKTEGRREKKKR